MSRVLAWIHRALTVLAFLATFSIDVKVKAELAQLPEAKTPEQEPADCWKSSGPCALRTSNGERATLKLGEQELVASENTLVVRVSENSIRVLSGTVWLKTKSPLSIDSEFGKIESEAGELWVTRTPSRLTVSAITAPVWLVPRGTEEKIEVSPGMENWLGHVQPAVGRAQSGVPVPIDFKGHLTRWSRLYAGKRADFEKEATEFYDRWTEAARASAEIHKALYDRKVAALDTVEEKRSEERRKSQKRTDELVRLFRSKVLDP